MYNEYVVKEIIASIGLDSPMASQEERDSYGHNSPIRTPIHQVANTLIRNSIAKMGSRHVSTPNHNSAVNLMALEQHVLNPKGKSGYLEVNPP